MADLVGVQLGTYRVTRFLGRGSFAAVYLGEDVYLKTEVAIKVLHDTQSRSEREQFLEEARLVASLKHPHIVRVLQYDIQNDIPFLVMDYASKGSLRERYPEGTRLSLPTVVTYVKQLASALQYAHDEKKIVHRDVNPRNILLDKNDEILLSDFGIATFSRTYRVGPMDRAGTYPYMAPEQIIGVPIRESDQYSLGIVVYEWLSGSLPFDGSIKEIIAKHLATPPPPFMKDLNIPAQVEQAVFKALAKEPHGRYSGVQTFFYALEQAAKQPIKVLPKPKPYIPPQSISQPGLHIPRRKFLVGLGVVALAGIGFGGYEKYHSITSPSPNGEILYQEDGSDNWNGWQGSSDWKVKNGLLINDGSNYGNNCSWADPSIVAPTNIDTTNFAVEAKIQVTSLGNNFGITVGGPYSSWAVWNGYAVEASDGGPDVCAAHSPGTVNPVHFDPGTDWHTYRVEVKGQHAKLLVDNGLIIQSDHIDNFSGKVGLLCGGTQINISSFKVFAL